MTEFEATPAPRITATQLRQALATRDGVVVQQQSTGATYALPQGMTKLQTLDGDLVVVLTNGEAAAYLRAAAGSYAKAARAATPELEWEIRMIDERLASWSAS